MDKSTKTLERLRWLFRDRVYDFPYILEQDDDAYDYLEFEKERDFEVFDAYWDAYWEEDRLSIEKAIKEFLLENPHLVNAAHEVSS